MRRLLQAPWHPRCLQPPRDINGHGLVSAWCWLFMLAGMWTPTVRADSTAPKSSSAPAAPRPGLLTPDLLTAAAVSHRIPDDAMQPCTDAIPSRQPHQPRDSEESQARFVVRDGRHRGCLQTLMGHARGPDVMLIAEDFNKRQLP
jgi:hypothetical protein